MLLLWPHECGSRQLTLPQAGKVTPPLRRGGRFQTIRRMAYSAFWRCDPQKTTAAAEDPLHICEKIKGKDVAEQLRTNYFYASRCAEAERPRQRGNQSEDSPRNVGLTSV